MPLLLADLPVESMRDGRACALVSPRTDDPVDRRSLEHTFRARSVVPSTCHTWGVCRWPVEIRRVDTTEEDEDDEVVPGE